MIIDRFSKLLIILSLLIIPIACQEEENTTNALGSYPAVASAFGGKVDLTSLADYAVQSKPAYITKDNTSTNPITDKGATLGRVLFYDVKLSTNNTVSCSSCHQQQTGFANNKVASTGANGVTTRHSMRLINSRFSAESKFFWDERALTLENQTTQPIQDHKEMGFSGSNGDPSLTDLITKLNSQAYYPELFKFVYGDAQITEARIQLALAQFIRSIQSFDSKYDIGRAQVANDNANFPNFSALENQGKALFLAPPQFDATGNRIAGGAGCNGCHRAPEFDIDPNTRNNGVVGVIGSSALDVTNTRAPSLRDLVNPDGTLNAQAMHDASLTTLEAIIDHYNEIVRVPGNNNLDPKLTPGGNLQKLLLTPTEKSAIISFIKTLSGTKVYTDSRWSSPF